MNIASNNIYSRSAEFVFLLSPTSKYNSTQDGGVFWNVWRISNRDKDNMQNGHGASFPVALPEQCLLNHSVKQNIALDLFGGSGTTLIACEKTNRKCFMMELDPHYCAVIIERWQQYAGQKAVSA